VSGRARAIAVIAPSWDQGRWARRLAALDPDRPVAVAPSPEAEGAAYAAVWMPPAGALTAMTNLELILNLGAGVDHLLADPALPDVPIVRQVGPDLGQRMAEHVALHALIHLRGHLGFAAQQAGRVWRPLAGPRADQVTVGIMGYGAMGRACAEKLAAIGFRLAGWTRTPQADPLAELFAGEGELEAFLARTEILVCLLPATPQTRGLLDARLFARLKRDGRFGAPALIAAGRGATQVEADILACLDDGTLAAASLDVFETEPLPASSPLWGHPRVAITPHCAADSHPDELAAGVIGQIAAFERGGADALRHVVDRALGY
jgi:glyoxylate/hydroxypyruvate reductase A